MDYFKNHPSIIPFTAAAFTGLLAVLPPDTNALKLGIMTCALTVVGIVLSIHENIRADQEAQRKEQELARIIEDSKPVEGWSRGEARTWTETITKQAGIEAKLMGKLRAPEPRRSTETDQDIQ